MRCARRNRRRPRLVEQTAGLGQLISDVVRPVTDVDTIKALADPTRLAILQALTRDRLPKSAKELAEELGEPQTKLYRHLKVLEEAKLIEAADTGWSSASWRPGTGLCSPR